MTIKPMLKYKRNKGRFFGKVDMGNVVRDESWRLANKVLAQQTESGGTDKTNAVCRDKGRILRVAYCKTFYGQFIYKRQNVYTAEQLLKGTSDTGGSASGRLSCRLS
ncbi:hypothetical protein DAPPUDRAFT_249318 [Daphnia pulex]|uniref:Uncharacterized protein n=1 Tax=Daphnia pulex TaxID=6669 RepID=E9GWE7_DAPPU|nr:hypothetical protein DAPPUDRAFT_249318 [Daphnia pulex]|eukprot:EFX76199.1 hypothetical protein DAPPUDRAFT_249318 [Daphnia pulex]